MQDIVIIFESFLNFLKNMRYGVLLFKFIFHNQTLVSYILQS